MNPEEADCIASGHVLNTHLFSVDFPVTSVWQLDILHHAINHIGLLSKTLVQRGRGDCVLVRGAPSSTSSSRWSCHSLINDSRSAGHQQLRAAHAHKTQHAYAEVQSNLLYVVFNCPLNSSDNNLRWRQAQVHNISTRGRCCIAYKVTWCIVLKCACMIVTWMHFLLVLHLGEKDITGIYNPACVKMHPLCRKDSKSCLWIFCSILQNN